VGRAAIRRSPFAIGQNEDAQLNDREILAKQAELGEVIENALEPAKTMIEEGLTRSLAKSGFASTSYIP
jgi:hypothetical protein